MKTSWGLTKPPLGSAIARGHPLAAGLAGCWLMNERAGAAAFDLSGVNAPAPLVGVIAHGVSGISNTSGYISVVNNAVLAAVETCTVIAACSTVSSSEQHILDTWNTGFSPSWYPVSLRTEGGIVTLKAYNGTNNPAATGIAVNDGKMHVIAGVRRKGVELRVYVDGVSRGSATDSATGTTATSSEFGIAGRPTAGVRWVGSIEYVYLFNRALDAAEIAFLCGEPYAFIQPPSPHRRWFIAPAAGFIPAWARSASSAHGSGVYVS